MTLSAPLESSHREGSLPTDKPVPSAIAPDSAGELQAAKESPVDFRDGVGIAGLASLVWGVWQIYSPAGWIVLGAALLVIAWRV